MWKESKMLVLLWLMVACLNVGAHEYRKITVDQIKNILADLYTSEPDEVIYSRNKEAIGTTAGYPEVIGTTAGYPEVISKPSSQSYPEESSSGIYPHESSTTGSVSVEYPESRPDDSEDFKPSEQYPDEDIGHKYPIQVGSIRGIPGINFPDYTDIPLTSFHCSDKVYVPGFYADMETGCQVFHVCWPHRRESFLCPVGTTFNQAILACDYWYSSNCSLALHYYDVNAASHTDVEHKDTHLGSMIDNLLEKGHIEPTVVPSEDSPESVSKKPYDDVLAYILKFLPVKTRVVVYPETMGGKSKIIAEASMGKTQQVHGSKLHQVYKIDSKPKYIPTHESTIPPTPQHKVTTVPTVVDPKLKLKEYIASEVDKIFNQVLDLLKKIKTEGEGLYPTISPTQKTTKIPQDKPKLIYEPKFEAYVAELERFFSQEGIDPVLKQFYYKVCGLVKEIMGGVKGYPTPIPELQKETAVPENEPKLKSKPSYDGIDPEVNKIIDQVFELVKKIVREAEGLVPTVSPRSQQRVTVAPKVEPKLKSKPSHGIYPAIKSFDKVFDVVKNLVKEAEALAPTLDVKENLQKVKPVPSRKPLPLTKLNQRFITKPVVLPKQNVVKNRPATIKPTTKVFKAATYVHPTGQTKSTAAKPTHKRTPKTSVSYRPSVSPSTKKALISNYLKMLKMKSG